MLMTPWQVAKKLWSWIRSKFWPPIAPPAPPVAAPPKLQHYIRSKQIVPGRVIVVNPGPESIRLEGPVLRMLYIPAGQLITVQSPLLEPVWRINAMAIDPKPNEPTRMQVQREIAFINEWDALEVVENMIEEYARARAYDLMTPNELALAELPLSKEALQPIIERIGIAAQRENENVSAQA